MCAVTVHDSAKVKGGKQIKIVKPKTIIQWCSYYGLKIEKGIVILYKGLDDNFKANHNGFEYKPGSQPIAPDWDNGQMECGGGLHFSPHPAMTLEFNTYAKRFVACPVRVKDCRKPQDSDIYPNKIKAKGCAAPIWEVDINGNKI